MELSGLKEMLKSKHLALNTASTICIKNIFLFLLNGKIFAGINVC